MTGPVARALLAEFRGGKPISRAEAIRRHGATAMVILDRMVKSGAAERAGDVITPITRAAPRAVVEGIEARERRLASDRAAQARKEAERRVLIDAIAAAPDEEARRRLIRDSQTLALGQSILAKRPKTQAVNCDQLESLFAIELDSQ